MQHPKNWREKKKKLVGIFRVHFTGVDFTFSFFPYFGDY